jgi:hypothetical protein
VETTRHLRRLEQAILELVREERTRPPRGYRGFDNYTSDDLIALPDDHARRRFIDREREIRELGIVELNRIPKPARPNLIALLPMTGMRVIDSFSDWLQEAIDDNAAKLGEVDGHERHLGVLVVRFDASTFPTETPLPELPPEVDVLWIVHGGRSRPGSRVVCAPWRRQVDVHRGRARRWRGIKHRSLNNDRERLRMG